MFAKAACALTNAVGGVLVVGMKANKGAKDEPDSISSTAPVVDTSAIKSRILDLIGQLVEPGIDGIEAIEVNEPEGCKSGFVVVYIPESEGAPRRSRKDWKFYQRIGSGTINMEYFQIEERFGRRPHPKLEVHLDSEKITSHPFTPSATIRCFVLSLQNVGRGIARFPSIRYRSACGLRLDRFVNAVGFGLKHHPIETEWVAFRGGIDDVIYPGETLKIACLVQNPEPGGQAEPLNNQVFKAVKVFCEVSCEGIATVAEEKMIDEKIL